MNTLNRAPPQYADLEALRDNPRLDPFAVPPETKGLFRIVPQRSGTIHRLWVIPPGAWPTESFPGEVIPIVVSAAEALDILGPHGFQISAELTETDGTRWIVPFTEILGPEPEPSFHGSGPVD